MNIKQVDIKELENIIYNQEVRFQNKRIYTLEQFCQEVFPKLLKNQSKVDLILDVYKSDFKFRKTTIGDINHFADKVIEPAIEDMFDTLLGIYDCIIEPEYDDDDSEENAKNDIINYIQHILLNETVIRSKNNEILYQIDFSNIIQDLIGAYNENNQNK